MVVCGYFSDASLVRSVALRTGGQGASPADWQSDRGAKQRGAQARCSLGETLKRHSRPSGDPGGPHDNTRCGFLNTGPSHRESGHSSSTDGLSPYASRGWHSRVKEFAGHSTASREGYQTLQATKPSDGAVSPRGQGKGPQGSMRWFESIHRLA